MTIVLSLRTYGGYYLCALSLIASCTVYAYASGSRGELAQRAKLFMVVSTLGLAGGPLCNIVLDWLTRFRPDRFDLFLYRMSDVFGLHPSFFLAQFLHTHPALLWPVAAAYNFCEAGVLCVAGLYIMRRPFSESNQVIATFLLNLFAALPIYLLVPACGPKYAFPAFPFTVPPYVVPHTISIAGHPPNCVPSVHVSTALLVAWFLWSWPLGRVAGAIFLFLTIVATLGSGEHYLIDVILAFPYTALVIWVCSALEPEPIEGALPFPCDAA